MRSPTGGGGRGGGGVDEGWRRWGARSLGTRQLHHRPGHPPPTRSRFATARRCLNAVEPRPPMLARPGGRRLPERPRRLHHARCGGGTGAVARAFTVLLPLWALLSKSFQAADGSFVGLVNFQASELPDGGRGRPDPAAPGGDRVRGRPGDAATPVGTAVLARGGRPTRPSLDPRGPTGLYAHHLLADRVCDHRHAGGRLLRLDRDLLAPLTTDAQLQELRLRHDGWRRLGQLLQFPLELAALTALFGTAIVFCGAYLVEKTPRFKQMRGVAQFLALLPLAVPGPGARPGLHLLLQQPV